MAEIFVVTRALAERNEDTYLACVYAANVGIFKDFDAAREVLMKEAKKFEAREEVLERIAGSSEADLENDRISFNIDCSANQAIVIIERREI